MADHWIAGAVGKQPGVFSAKAKAAGDSTAEYASEKDDAPGKLGQQARLAQTLMGLHKGGHKAPQNAAKHMADALHAKMADGA